MSGSPPPDRPSHTPTQPAHGAVGRDSPQPASWVERCWPPLDPAWIVYEDDDLIAVEKPAGVPSQPADAEQGDDLVTRVRMHLSARDGVAFERVYLGVHQRLEREVSGVLVFTRHKRANPGLARQLEHGQAERVYVAAAPASAGPKRRALQAAVSRKHGRRARAAASSRRVEVTREVTRDERGLYTLRISRTLPLRATLAAHGLPVAGDLEHGGPAAARLMLHAGELSLKHPLNEAPLHLRSETPRELQRWSHVGDAHPFDEPEVLKARLQAAMQARWGLGRGMADAEPTTVFRLVNEEGDGLPSLAVDVYERWLVAHLYGPPAEPAEARLLEALDGLGFAGLYVKRHPRQKNVVVDPRDSRWAPPAPLRGEPAPAPLLVQEHGVPFEARLDEGLRTGLFPDQRANRLRVRRAAAEARVLNLFAYTCGFSVAALAGGAREVVSVDASAVLLRWGERNATRVADAARHRTRLGDAFEVLDELQARRQRFELVIVDPPTYATTRGTRFRAARDYPRLAASAMRVAAAGGSLLLCTNHRGTSQAAFRRQAREGARLAGRRVRALEDRPPGSDFPVRSPAQRHALRALWVTLE